MKKIIYIIIFAFIFINCSGQSNNKIKSISSDIQMKKLSVIEIDTVIVLKTEFDIYTATSISRNDFLDFFNSEGTYKMLTDKQQITDMCQLLENLPVVTDSTYLKVMPNDYMYKIRQNKGRLIFFNTDPLDVRVHIILYPQGGKPIIIWMSKTLTDIDNRRFFTTKDIRQYIEKL